MLAGKETGLLSSLAPIVDKNAKILVLGSMPGQRSLDAQAYYAHPQNNFWLFVQMLDAGEAVSEQKPRLPTLVYAEKVTLAKRMNIALWDVLKSCRREGSLDSAIESKSEIANDFETILRCHSSIRRLCFNGNKALSVFEKKVQPNLELDLSRYELLALPSTSPANAGIPFYTKAQAWLEALTIE